MNIINYLIEIVSPIRILLTLFALFAWSRVFLRFKDKSINQKELVFWSLIWLGTIVIVFIPGKTTVFARLLGMGRGFDAMMFMAVIALFYAVYRLYIKANETDQEITRLVRQIALRSGVTKPSETQKEQK